MEPGCLHCCSWYKEEHLDKQPQTWETARWLLSLCKEPEVHVMWNNEAAQLNSVPSGVVEKRVNKSCLTKARSHYSCRFATITDVSFQDLPFARLSSSWNPASDFIKHVAVTLDSPGLCEGCVSHIYKPLSSLPFSLPPSLHSGIGVNAAQITKCPDSQVWIIMSWPWAFLHRRSTSPPCQVAKVNTFVLLCRVQLRLQGGGGKKGAIGWENRETQRQRAAEGWKREEIRGGRKRKGGGNSPIHSFTPLLHFERSLVKVGQHGNLKFSQMPVEEVRSCGGLPSSLISLSFTASQPARSTSAAWQHRRFWDWATAIKHASRFQAWS